MKNIFKIFAILIISTMIFACGKKETDNTKNTRTEEVVSSGIDLQEMPFETFNFQTTNISDGSIVESNEIYKAKPYTFVNIWATYCGPCKKELPDLQKAYENYGDKVNFIGVVSDTTATLNTNVEEALKIMNDSGVKYTNIMPNPTMEKDLNTITAVPTSFIVDSEGNVVGGFVGAHSYDDISATIEEIINK